MKRIKIKKSAEFKKLEEFKQQKRRKLLKEAEEFINGIEAKVHYAAEEKLKNDLSQAIKTNNPEKIKALVEIKADPNNMLNESDHRFHNRKKTMLSYAIFCVAPNAIQALIDAKADINQENPAFELWYHHSQGYTTLQHIYPARTPLEYAIEHEIYRKMSDEENEKQPLEVKQWISGGGERRD
ncbi:MAG TPA: hypothetical protein VHM20_07775, partial [Gammaproteobacteria bacterium]|nr:hypothetical protein [Gammaproteobacteria bacterium]